MLTATGSIARTSPALLKPGANRSESPTRPVGIVGTLRMHPPSARPAHLLQCHHVPKHPTPLLGRGNARMATHPGGQPQRGRPTSRAPAGELSRPARGLTVTNIHPPLVAVTARAWSAGLTRRGGRPTSDTSPATKTAPKARPWAPSSTASATAPSSATPSSSLATPHRATPFRTYTGQGRSYVER